LYAPLLGWVLVAAGSSRAAAKNPRSVKRRRGPCRALVPAVSSFGALGHVTFYFLRFSVRPLDKRVGLLRGPFLPRPVSARTQPAPVAPATTVSRLGRVRRRGYGEWGGRDPAQRRRLQHARPIKHKKERIQRLDQSTSTIPPTPATRELDHNSMTKGAWTEEPGISGRRFPNPTQKRSTGLFYVNAPHWSSQTEGNPAVHQPNLPPHTPDPCPRPNMARRCWPRTTPNTPTF